MQTKQTENKNKSQNMEQNKLFSHTPSMYSIYIECKGIV